MRLFATMLLVGALALVGCDKGEDHAADGGSSTTPEKATGANPNAGASKPGAAPGGHATSEGKAAAADPASFDRATAEGTFGLFVTRMQRAEFEEAVQLADPESVGYQEMAQTVTVLAQAASNPEAQAAAFESLMRAFFSRGWHGAVWQPVSVQDERARFEVKLVDMEPRTIDLRKMDEEWFVVVPEWVPRVKGSVDDLMPSTAPGSDTGSTNPDSE